MTLYDILGVSPTSTAKNIRTAFRTKARKIHPDKRQLNDDKYDDSSEASFVELQQAYDVLGDEKCRQEYDKTLLHKSTTSARISQEVFLDELQTTQVDTLEGTSTCYSVACRCGDAYRIWDEELEEDIDIVPCDGCSLYIRIKTRQSVCY